MSKKPDILIAATHLFASKGFKETSTAELASIIGAAESTIFYHYKTKEEILLAVLKTIREDLLSNSNAIMQKSSFPMGSPCWRIPYPIISIWPDRSLKPFSCFITASPTNLPR